LAEAPIETEPQRHRGQHAPRLSRLIRAQFGFVWRLLRRIGVAESEADSAAGQVFSAAAQRIGDIRSGSERAFLVSTALHIASRFKRERSELAAPISDSAPALEDLDEQQQAREILDVVLEQMPLELRVVFVLHEIEGLTGSEIAELVGIPLGMVAERLAEAHEDFATHLEAGSDLAQSLMTAARDEQPKPVALARALRIVGSSEHAASAQVEAGAVSSPGVLSERAKAPRSIYGLAVKWLVIGLLVGLALTTAVYEAADAMALSRGADTR
jgi:RNA polymerase sigma-70 factor (ECF subfamily)